MPSALSRDAVAHSPVGRWLSIIGIGEDGVDGLPASARGLIEAAELVVGSERQLALAGTLVKQQRLVWPSPLLDAIPAVLARRGTPTCVLASGDPFLYGVGATLAAHVGTEEFICLPAPSSFSLAASKLGWALQDAAVVTLHGRALELVIPLLQPSSRILALSWDGSTPGRLAELLSTRGFGRSTLHVLEALGGARERIRKAEAGGFDLQDIDALNVVAIDVVAGPDALVVPKVPGIPDALFETDGQITKQDIRAVTLSALAPRAGELLWDVGAGSGSIAIEWMLCHASCRAVAIEERKDRAARIRRNAAFLGTPGLELVEGSAPRALEGLPRPDAIFIGGGASQSRVFEICWEALKPAGRLVASAVSLETEALLLRWFASYGGDLRRISIERACPLGTMTGWRPAMPVTQWKATKP